jgi:WD40 repeat protein
MKFLITFQFALALTYIKAQFLELGLPVGHHESIKCLELIENEEYMVTGGLDGQVILWETRSGKKIRTLFTGSKAITNLFYLTTKNELIICQENGLPIVSNLYGDSLSSFHGESGQVNSIFLLNDSTLLSDWNNGDLRIWDINQYYSKSTLKGPGGGITDIEISTDKKKIVASFWNEEIYVWDVTRNCELKRLIGHKNWVTSVTFDPKDSLLISTSYDSTAILWDLNTGEKLHHLKGHLSTVMNAYFEPLSGDILTCSENDTVTRRWDHHTGLAKPTIDGDKYTPQQIVFHPSGKSKLLISYRYFLLIYDGQEIVHHFANPEGTTARYFDSGTKIAISCYDSILVYDTRSGTLLKSLKTEVMNLNGFDYSENNDQLLLFGETLNLIDLLTGKIISANDLHPIPRNIVDGAFNPNGKNFALIGKNGLITLSGKSQLFIDAHSYAGTGNHSLGHSVNFNKYGTHIASTGRDKFTRIWDVSTGKLIDEKMSPYWAPQSAIINTDVSQTVSISNDHTLTIWKIGREFDDRYFQGATENKNGIQYNPDETMIAAGSNQNIHIYDLKNDSNYSLTGHQDWVEAIDFHPNGTTMISSDRSGKIFLWDLIGQQEVKRVQGSQSRIHSVQFVKNGDWFITSTSNEIQVWNSSTFQNELTILIFDSINFIIKNKEGYFMATQNAAPKVYYTIDNKTISFEQFDLKYNRPDLILKTLNKITGNQNDILREVLHLTYQKRLRKHGMDMNLFTNVLSFPEGEIKNGPQLEYEQSNQFLDIQILGKDSSSFLDRFNVWINDVPLYAENGINLKNSMTHYLDTTIQIELSYGLNRVEVSLTNVNGIESLRSPLFLNFSSISQKSPKTYFIGIGINEFEQTGHDLDFAVKDIHDFIEELKNHSKDLLIIDTLFNQSVTLYNVQAIKTQLEKLSVNDKVILSYSGHGLLDDQLNYYLSSFEVDFSNPKVGGIPYETIEYLLDGIPSRRKLVLIDACNSGEIDKDTLHTSKFGESEKQSITEASTKGDLFNTLNHLKDPFELINEMFMNIERGSGAFIISASGGYQSAHEGGNIKNGYFTYAILEFLKNHHSVSITELYKYIVPRVEQLSEGKQRPTTRMQNMNVDWQIY